MIFFVSCIFMVMIVGIPIYGLYKGTDIFSSFGDGVKEGAHTVFAMLPFILGMFTAVHMLRSSGFFVLVADMFGPFFVYCGIPVEIVPLMLIRPFSGSASNGFMVDILKQYGGNSTVGMTAATIMGSTETTLYIAAFYFGAVGVKKMRYALWTSLLADVVGMIVAIIIVPRIFA